MSTLHWICALTLALVCCVSAQPVKQNPKNEMTKEMRKNILLGTFEHFKNVIRDNCPNDTQIYSPADILQVCLSSALSCTNKGLDELGYECGLTKGKKDDLNRLTKKKKNDLISFQNFYSRLDYAKNETSPSPSSCSACEMYPPKNAEEFLEDVRSLVQQW